MSHNDEGGVLPLEARSASGLAGQTSSSFPATTETAVERQLRRVNRALRMLSRCNSALFLAGDEDSLFKEIADIALMVGGYRFAWIGLAEEDDDRTIRIAARAGCEDFDNNLDGVPLSWSGDLTSGAGISGQTIREGRPVICEDLTAPGSGLDSAIVTRAAAQGLRSVLSLPLRGRDKILGLIALYSDTAGGFDDDEVSLCQELADNLAFGLEHLRQVEDRELLEGAVLKIASSINPVTGMEFFSELSAAVADTLGAEVCVISRLLPDNPGQAVILGGVQGGRVLPVQTYDLENAPCRALEAVAEYVIEAAVQRQIPPSSLLSAAQAESYVGVRLTDRSGTMIGTLCVAFRTPLRKRDFVLSVLRIFASRAAAELEREEARVHLYEKAALLDKAQDAIIVLGLDYVVSYWNKGAERLYGWTVDEVVGRPPNPSHHEGHRAATETAMAATLASGEWWGKFTHQRKDGELITVEAHWSLVRSDSGEPRAIFCIHSDVTRKQALEAQLEQSRRLASLGQLMGGVAHDFNNLLTVIVGNAELLAEELGDDSRLSVLVQMICQASQRGANLTRSLLAVARRQSLVATSVDVGKMLSEMEELLSRTLRGDIQLKMDLAPDAWPALVDMAQLESAIINLCLNARDAMPDGGVITLETLNHQIPDGPDTHLRELAPGDYLMLRISDTGTGIAQEHLSRLFDPFFTTKDKGTGLGLSMVYGFVKQSQGEITVSSIQGAGTCVTLLLPRAHTALTASMPGVVTDALDGISGDRVILVVEDDEMVRSFAVTQLRAAGYQVLEAENGAAGLAILDSGRHVDLLFSDVIMPGAMTGPQLAHQARRRYPGIKVLFTSGYTDDHLGEEWGRDGAYLLNKPYRQAELLARVRQVLCEQTV